MNPNLSYFKANEREFGKRYNGRYILIKDSADAGVFDTFEDAMMEAVSRHYEPGTFIVQLCTANPDAAVQKFYSRAVFA